VEQRLAAKLDSGRGHPVEADARVGGLKRPRLVGDLDSDQPAVSLGEETVALDEELLEGSRYRVCGWRLRCITRGERGVPCRAQVVDRFAVADHPEQDARLIIGERVGEPIASAGSRPRWMSDRSAGARLP
jgi:hypothetical protein